MLWISRQAALGMKEHHVFHKRLLHSLADITDIIYAALAESENSCQLFIPPRKITSFGKHIVSINYINSLLSKFRKQVYLESENLNSKRHQYYIDY